jgi:nucleoside-diphosphate-sugar epimerase
VQALRGEPLTIYGEGSQTRSFCYVSDLIAGIVKLLETDRRDEVEIPVNIGNPEEKTVRELADIILRLTGSRSTIVKKELPVDDPQVRCPDITRAKKLLGWQPEVPTEQGLQKTIDYFRRLTS